MNKAEPFSVTYSEKLSRKGDYSDRQRVKDHIRAYGLNQVSFSRREYAVAAAEEAGLKEGEYSILEFVANIDPLER